MASIYGADVMVDLNKSPYRAEMKELSQKELPEGLYFNPKMFDECVGDLNKIEARLVRLILRLIQFDKNYMGVVELSGDVCKKFAVGTGFTAPLIYLALKDLTRNNNEGEKPFIVQFSNRSRLYWVNPAIACKKSLIDKFEDCDEVCVDEEEAEEAD